MTAKEELKLLIMAMSDEQLERFKSQLHQVLKEKTE